MKNVKRAPKFSVRALVAWVADYKARDIAKLYRLIRSRKTTKTFAKKSFLVAFLAKKYFLSVFVRFDLTALALVAHFLTTRPLERCLNLFAELSCWFRSSNHKIVYISLSHSFFTIHLSFNILWIICRCCSVVNIRANLTISTLADPTLTNGQWPSWNRFEISLFLLFSVHISWLFDFWRNFQDQSVDELVEMWTNEGLLQKGEHGGENGEEHVGLFFWFFLTIWLQRFIANRITKKTTIIQSSQANRITRAPGATPCARRRRQRPARAT